MLTSIAPWVSAPKATHSQVWLEFENNGGWNSLTLSIFIGALTGASAQTGIDTAAHMAEEVKDAARAVPYAMLSVFVVNMVLIFPAVVTICYHIPDLTAALEDPTTYPAVYVLRQSMSTTWILLFLTAVALLNCASNLSYLAAVRHNCNAGFNLWKSGTLLTRTRSLATPLHSPEIRVYHFLHGFLSCTRSTRLQLTPLLFPV